MVEVTEHQYDRGRLIRSTTTREPEWTEQDRTEILALIEYERSLCPCGCGHLYADSTSNWETGPEFTVTRTTCRARAALLEQQRAAAEADGGAGDNGARLWSTVLTRG